MTKLNCVLVGVGHDHAHDIFDYITSPDSDFNLLGICLVEKDEDNYRLYQKDYDKYPHITIEEALDKQLNAAFIECEDNLLSKYALMFAEKGVHIHMDKPGSQNKEEFDAAILKAKEKQSAFHLGYMYRYNPSIKEALRLHREGSLGEIYYIEAQMNISYPEKKRIWLNQFQGGMMNYLGCHLIDLLCLFLGKPDSVISYKNRSKPNCGEDIALAIFKYGDRFSTINSTMVEIDGFSRRHVVIVAENATIEIAPTEVFIDGKLYSRSVYKLIEVDPRFPLGEVKYGPTHRYKEMIDEFAKICRKEIANPFTYEHEMLVHDTLLAVIKGNEKEVKL